MNSKDWFAARRKKLGVETDEEVKEHARKTASKSRRNWKGNGHFADPEKARKAAKKRWQNEAND